MCKVILLAALIALPGAGGATRDGAENCPERLLTSGRRAWLIGAGITGLSLYLGWRLLSTGSSPRLILVEEDHESPQARQTMQSLGLRGLRGEVLVGYENLLVDGNRPVQQRSFRAISGAGPSDDHTIHGLEAGIVHAGVELFLLRGGFSPVVHAPSVETWTGFLTGLGVVLRDNPHQADLWKKALSGASASDSLKELHALLTSAEWLAECESTSAQDEARAFLRRAEKVARSRFIRDRTLLEQVSAALLGVLRDYVAFMNTVESKHKYATPPSLGRLLLTPAPAKEDFEDAVLRWRNERMMETIASLWAKAQREGKDLYLVVGAQHRPGLEKLIRERLSPGTAFQVVNEVASP